LPARSFTDGIIPRRRPGQDKNFAGLLPLWDILFRIHYIPEKQPSHFGVADAVPSGLVAKMVWPFSS